MDSELYPLVPIPRGQTSLVPIPVDLLVVDPDRDDEDFVARLWRFCLGLAVLLWLALVAIRLLRRERLELRCQTGYWQSMHQRAVAREAELELQVANLKLQIREWKRRVYGRRTETASATTPQPQSNDTPPSRPAPRPRGQQPGSAGPGRRNHDHLPARDETRDLPEDQRCCSQCREPFEEIPGTADGVLLEIEVKAYRRVYHRKRYRRR